MPPLRAVSLIGNLLALTLIATVMAQSRPLTAVMHDRSARFSIESNSRYGPVRGAAFEPVSAGPPHDTLLIVIDALRLDVSRDAGTMPFLVGLARAGEARTLRVTQPVPSTVGALPAFVEGRAVAASAALFDLTPRPAQAGGLLATLHALDAPAEIGGTALWAGLYARWLGDGLSIGGMPSARSDTAIVRWASERLGERTAPPLLIAHLGALDAVAHRYGVGAQYRATARRIDGAIDRLVSVARREGRAVLITSDHGVTQRGGHAGGEAVVRDVPLVAVSGSLGMADGAPQHIVASALADRLGLAVMPEPNVHASPLRERLGGLGLTVVAWLAAWRALGRLATLGRERRAATVLACLPWLAGVLGILIVPPAGAALAACALIGAASYAPATGGTADAGRVQHAPPACGRSRTNGDDRSGALACLLVGSVVASVAMACAWIGLPAVSGHSVVGVPVALLAATAGVVIVGRRLAGGPWRAWSGVVAVASLALLSLAAGDGISLSALDVSLAHRAADGPGGVATAVGVAIVRLWWLPGVLALALLSRASVRHVARGPRRATGPSAVRPDVLLAVQAAARTTLAAIMVYGLVLHLAWPDAPIVFGIALGGTLHAFSSWMGVLVVATAVLFVVRHRHDPIPATAREAHR